MSKDPSPPEGRDHSRLSHACLQQSTAMPVGARSHLVLPAGFTESGGDEYVLMLQRKLGRLALSSWTLRYSFKARKVRSGLERVWVSTARVGSLMASLVAPAMVAHQAHPEDFGTGPWGTCILRDGGVAACEYVLSMLLRFGRALSIQRHNGQGRWRPLSRCKRFKRPRNGANGRLEDVLAARPRPRMPPDKPAPASSRGLVVGEGA